jgi:hypothetical protein
LAQSSGISPDISRILHCGDAFSRYRRALANANKHDQQAALAADTAVIDMKNAPPICGPMALDNRSVVYTAAHHDTQAISDLEQLLKMPGAAAQVSVEARRKLVRMKRTSERADERPSPRES